MKVSICIPAYNSPETVQRLLDSIFVQTFTDYEVIVSDDSSNGTVESVVKAYSDKHISYYHNEKPLGTPENWNNAVRKAKGEYIKLMHHDDWFVDENALEIMVDEMEMSGSDFVFCQSDGECPNRPTDNEVTFYAGEKLPYLLIRNIIGAPSATMYKKTALEYDSSIKYYVDVDFYIQYLSERKFRYIPKELVKIGTTPFRVTDAVVSNRQFVYDEFQYSFLKLWNSGVWKHSVLNDVFRIYINVNPDFQECQAEGLLASQKRIIYLQQFKCCYKMIKKKIKRIFKW